MADEFDSKTSFGFKTVSAEDKPGLVADVFRRVASRYDRMNDVMSLGIHRYWKHELLTLLRPRPQMHLLDMAGGTGDIAFRFLEITKGMAPPPCVTVCDSNPDMLQVGRRRAINKGILKNITWVTGDATNIPFPDNTFEAYTISFGLRNVADIEKALQEAWRVLKPGGTFLCLEFSKVSSPLLDKLYHFYSFKVIPTLGEIVARDAAAYQYLVESIARFPFQEDVAHLLEKTGFHQVAWRNLTGGIVAIHSALKLPSSSEQ